MDVGWPEILIIAAVVLVLFGSKKMPDAARSLGRSMRILKSEVKGMHEDDAQDGSGTTAPTAALPPAAPTPPPVVTPAAPAEAPPVAAPVSAPDHAHTS